MIPRSMVREAESSRWNAQAGRFGSKKGGRSFCAPFFSLSTSFLLGKSPLLSPKMSTSLDLAISYRCDVITFGNGTFGTTGVVS